MTAFEIRPLTPTIGAEIYDLDLGEPLTPSTRNQVEKALLDHMVLLFRGQDITPEQQLAFGRNFGDVYCPAMSAFVPEHPEIMLIDTTTPKGAGADNWHCDATFMPEPPLGAVLRPVQLPPSGGDTCFANMAAVYDALSPAFRSLLDGLPAVHDLTPQLRISVERGVSPESFETLQKKWPPVEHPVVRTHPVTGRKSLYLNRNTGSRLKGLTDKENNLLLPFLLDLVHSPEFQCRIHWESDCIAFWDNRCVQHCGVPDFDQRRIMHRVTIAGDKPR